MATEDRAATASLAPAYGYIDRDAGVIHAAIKRSGGFSAGCGSAPRGLRRYDLDRAPTADLEYCDACQQRFPEFGGNHE